MYKIFLKDTNEEAKNAVMANDGSILVLSDTGYRIGSKDEFSIKEYPVPCFEEFEKLILTMQENDRKHDQLNTALSEVCIDSILYFPTLKQEILDYLNYAFGDENDWIGYYVCELDYGKEWKPGFVTDQDGSDIKLQTIKELYTLLLDNLR